MQKNNEVLQLLTAKFGYEGIQYLLGYDWLVHSYKK